MPSSHGRPARATLYARPRCGPERQSRRPGGGGDSQAGEPQPARTLGCYSCGAHVRPRRRLSLLALLLLTALLLVALLASLLLLLALLLLAFLLLSLALLLALLLLLAFLLSHAFTSFCTSAPAIHQSLLRKVGGTT